MVLSRSERGSQALEFALVLPAVAFLIGLVVHAAVLGGDLVVAQGIAREAARAASLGEDPAAVAAATAGDRPVTVTVDRDDGSVRVSIRLSSRAFAAFGAGVEVPAEAVMRVQAR